MYGKLYFSAHSRQRDAIRPAPAATTTGTRQPVSRSENRRTSTRKLGGLS